MKSLVDLLLGVKESPERDSFIKKVQQPQLEVEEEFIHQELSRLESVQQFYHTLAVATAVADEGKKALKPSGPADNQEIIASRPVRAALDKLLLSIAPSPNTYGKAVEEVSTKIVEATETAFERIASQRWEKYLTSLDQEVAKIKSLSPLKLDVDAIVNAGWVKFDTSQSPGLIFLTGSQRWLLTKKMISQKNSWGFSSRPKGVQLVQEVGKGAASFIKTLYGRLVAVLLAFDKRTNQAGEMDPKPADRVAKILFDSLLQSYQALLKVKKEEKFEDQIRAREEDVVKELEKLGEIHASATNKGSADAVFLATLILKLLSILQPEGLSADIQKAIMSAVHGRSGEVNLIQRAVEKYNGSIQPAVEPWVKPIGNFLLQALENIIERQSANNVAKQMSELLNPIHINAALIDLLKDDQSELKVQEEITGPENSLTWSSTNEDNIRSLLSTRALTIGQIEALEATLKETEKAKGDTKKFLGELVDKKAALAEGDMRLLPELLKRIVLANVPSSFKGYVLQFSYDLFELIQYPRILRHIAFNVMEKAVHTLQPLDKAKTVQCLDEPADTNAQKSLTDFLFLSQQKTHIGDTLVALFWNMAPAENTGSIFTWITQTTVKRLPIGGFLFSLIQQKVESLVQKKFEDPEAVNWSGAKLIGWLNKKIVTLAEDPTDKGLTAKITAVLEQAL